MERLRNVNVLLSEQTAAVGKRGRQKMLVQHLEPKRLTAARAMQNVITIRGIQVNTLRLVP